jgi:hypothetical protein
MTPKRGERVAPPPGLGEFDLYFASNEAAKGWVDLCGQAPGNAYEVWNRLRTEPAPAIRMSRQHPLKGGLAMAAHRGIVLPQWQYEVTGAAGSGI